MIDALPLLLGPEGYQISRSVRLRSSASAYLQRTNGTTGTDPLKFTVSGWIKRGLSSAAYFPLLGSDTGTNAFDFIGFQSDNLVFRIRNSSSTDLVRVESSAVYRDFSAWYHIVAVYDSANATASERVKLYVNGVQLTAFGTATYPSLNQAPTGDFLTDMQIGRTNTNSTTQNYGDGYLTEVNFIDGLTPNTTTRTVGGVTQTVLTELGEFDAVTGVWKPARWTRSFGTNGFYLNFSDNSAATAAAIGKDYSGNGNNWTPNNISVTAGVTYDSMLDVPTQWADGGNGRGNYATLNPLDNFKSATPTNGNLSIPGTGSCKATMPFPSGKWYWEFSVTGLSGVAFVGIATDTTNAGITSGNYWLYRSDGQRQTTSGASAYGASYTSGDVIGIAYDADTNTLTFYKNNTSQGNISVTSGFVLFPMVVQSSSTTYDLNFGQRPFSYTPPSGFKALNTLNLPTPTILKGNQYFDVSLWTGTGSAQSITNSGSMQPDFVWGKIRSGADYHVLANAVVGADKFLKSNATDAETTNAQTITAFNSNGFSVGTSTDLNRSTYTFVGWQWKEGATQGFDIVTYTGTGVARTINHALGVKPSMIIIKNRSGAYDWPTWHQNLPNPTTQHFWLNATNAAQVSGSFNSTQPTSSVFSVGTTGEANANGNNFVAYLFSEVAGFSKFGSYTGNGSADGPFVFCGFRPRWLLIKETTPNARNWIVFDTARNTFNQVGLNLLPNSSAAEDAGSGLYNQLDILSNGFKLRAATNSEPTNESGATYIFAAFAEHPFKYSLAR